MNWDGGVGMYGIINVKREEGDVIIPTPHPK